MLKRIIGLGALFALVLGIGGSVWRHSLPSTPRVSSPMAVVAIPVAPSAPAPAPPLAPAPPPAPALAAVPAAPPPPAAAKDSDLPTVEVGQHIVHTIDESAALPIPTVTLHQKDGQRVVERGAAAEPAPRPAPSRAATPATAAASNFRVAGLPVHLFGVRPPEPRDRCGSGTAASCGDGARAAVAARLGNAGNVKCTVPAGQPGDPGYLCRDGAGVDLGGLLVAQGLALADTSTSYNYVGAQNEARSSRRGLWAYR